MEVGEGDGSGVGGIAELGSGEGTENDVVRNKRANPPRPSAIRASVSVKNLRLIFMFASTAILPQSPRALEFFGQLDRQYNAPRKCPTSLVDDSFSDQSPI